MGGAGGKPCILVYGSDRSLLATRQWVLEAGGFEVAVSNSGAETEQLLRTRPIALLLLCHSVAPEYCRQALTMAATVSPRTPRLLLDGKSALSMKALCHSTFDAMNGPKALIDTIQRMITAQSEQAASSEIVTPRR